MTAWAAEAVARLQAAFEPARDRGRAGPMAAYMRDRFPFLGIATPERTRLQRGAVAGLAEPEQPDVLAAARALWALPEREYQYAACSLLDVHSARLTTGALPELRWLVTSNAWWDTVDTLRKPLGAVVLAAPELKAELRRWNGGDDRWLVRSSIIVQLGFKRRTDEAFLFEMCANRATDPEFFVRKGIGWALREYSKVDGGAVRHFVADHPELSALSRREALKWIERRQGGSDP